jgi:hypothetical protein
MPRALTRRRAFGMTLALLAAPIAFAAPTPEHPTPEHRALAEAEWKAIQRVIESQLAALREGKAERAFSFAADGIREQLGDAATFMEMVRQGYGALLTARYTEFLEGAVIEGVVIQPLRLVDPDNSVRVALYTMQKDGARWRIAGCAIAPSTVRAA